MYEETKKRMNWVATILKVIVLVLVILLSTKLINVIVNNQRFSKKENQYNKILKSMDDYANKLFTVDNIPESSGKAKVIYLKELVKDKKIENNESCDLNNSYIKVVRLDTEYEIKTYLLCDEYENSINTYKELNKDITVKPHTTKKQKTTKKIRTTKKYTTTKKVKTTIRKYNISFNTNGGEQINNIQIKANGLITNEPIPVRKGYKFIGWYYHGNKFNFNTRINQDYVLTARWVLE